MKCRKNLRTLFAEYNGASSYALSTTTFAQTVFRSFSWTSMTSSINPATFGRPVTFRVAVASAGDGAGMPTGTVALYRVGANNSRRFIGQATLRNGVARITSWARKRWIVPSSSLRHMTPRQRPSSMMRSMAKYSM